MYSLSSMRGKQTVNGFTLAGMPLIFATPIENFGVGAMQSSRVMYSLYVSLCAVTNN